MKPLRRILNNLFPRRIYFSYAGFWDFPLGMIVRHRGRVYLFERLFDEESDEYEDFYTVYDATSVADLPDKEIFDPTRTSELEFLGRIMVKDIEFDESRRKWMSGSAVERYQVLR